MRQMQENMEDFQRRMQEQLQCMGAPLGTQPMAVPMPAMPPMFHPSLPLTQPGDLNQDTGFPIPNNAVNSMPLSSSPNSTHTFNHNGHQVRQSYSPVPSVDPHAMVPFMAHSPIPQSQIHNNIKEAMTIDRNGKKQLNLHLNMANFNPSDVQVKTNKNSLEVSAHHEEKNPNRVSCRVFHQKYELPQDVRLAKTQYNMNNDGTLDVHSKVKPNYRVKFGGEQFKEILPK